MIISELRDSFVTIVTESAVFVTSIVTKSDLTSTSLLRGRENSSDRRKNRPVFRLFETCQDSVTTLTRNEGYSEL